MIHQSEIASRESQRQELAAQVAEFLAKGGKVEQIDEPTIRTEKELRTGLSKTLSEEGNHGNMRVRNQRKRATALRACGLSDREIARRMEISTRELKKLFP